MSEQNGGQVARVTVIDVPLSQQRSLETVTAEIRAYQDAARRMALNYSIEIGRRLTEAKTMVAHGEWGTYLRDELGFSQSTANNHMRLFEAYGADQMTLDGAAVKNQALADLSYTQALALLALPSETEREAFVAEHDMEKISTRELQAEIAKLREEKAAAEAERDRAVADRDKAEAGEDHELRRAEDLTIERDRLKEQLGKVQGEAASVRAANDALKKERKTDAENVAKFQKQAIAANKARDEAKKEADALRKELEQAKENPSVPQDVLDRLKREAEETARKAAEEEMAHTVRRYTEEKEAAQKALALAAPEMAVFKASFERVQKDLLALARSIDELPEDKKDGCWRAMGALAAQITGIVHAHEGQEVSANG